MTSMIVCLNDEGMGHVWRTPAKATKVLQRLLDVETLGREGGVDCPARGCDRAVDYLPG